MIKKLTLAIISLMLFVAIAATCAERAEAADKPLKCKYKDKTWINVYSPLEGKFTGGLILFGEGTITVLETKMIPVKEDDGTESEDEVYRFSGNYDNVLIYCPSGQPHGHPIQEYKPIFDRADPGILDNLLMFTEDATCE